MDDDTDYEDEVWNEDETPDTEGESPSKQDDEEMTEQIKSECLEHFSSRDFIMEPGIISSLKRYFQAGGNPEQVVELLSLNYRATAQIANLLAEWLIMTGLKISEVQSLVEDHLKQMIIKHFDPKKADSIFMMDEAKTPSWLAEMIEHPTWRSLIYRLAEEYPDCLMLTFTIKLISDAGFQGEITSISTAAQQLEVFARILRTAINNFLEHGEDKNLAGFSKMVCHGEHTYLYSQAILHVLSQEAKGGANIKRLSQEIAKYAQTHGHDATPILMALNGATLKHQRECLALSAMLSKNSLNPADITVLYRSYQATESPPVELIRIPQFLDLLLDALFKPGSKLHPEHKPKYTYLLAYAASVYETFKKNVRKNVNRDELKSTLNAIDKVSVLCTEKKGTNDLLMELNNLFNYIKTPVVSLGIVHWVKYVVSEKSYFQLNTDSTPIHLALLDEVTSSHNTLHHKVLDLYISLFETPQDDLDVLVQLDIKKMLLDRMVHLLSNGCVVPVINYIKTCWTRQDTDMSLIRYFVTEVLDVISPPYAPEFVTLFYPLVASEEVMTGNMKDSEHEKLVNKFISQCKAKHASSITSMAKS